MKKKTKEPAKTRVIITVAVKHNGKYLILHRAKENRFDPKLWEPVSQRVADKKPLEVLVLEAVKLRTGLDVTIEKAGSAFEFNDVEGRWIVVPFLANSDSDIITLTKEHDDHKWVDASEIEKLDEDKFIIENFKALEII